MDDTTVDSTDTGYDDTGADSTVSDDTGYSDSSADAGSESSSSYYDADCEDGASVVGDSEDSSSSYDTEDSSTYDSDDSSSYDTDDSGSSYADDTSAETTAVTSTSGATDTEPVATEANTADATVASETAAASQDPAAAMDCPPAFPLSGVTTPEVASVPADQTAAVAADTGTPTDYPATDMPAQQPPSFQGIPHGVLSAEQEQAFVQTGWAPALVPDGHGGQVEVLQPAGVDPATFQGQLQFLDSHLRNLIAQQQGGTAPAGTVPPIPGTNSGPGTPVAFDAAGNPTHVSYSGVVNPPTTMVQMGGNSALYSNGRWMGGDFPQGTTIENFGGPMRLAPGAPTPAVDPNTPGGAAYLDLQTLHNQTLADMATATLTGVTHDRSTGLVYGDGKPFSNFGDALSAERHPDGPAPR